MAKFINLTPHLVEDISAGKKYEKSDNPLRVPIERVLIGTLDDGTELYKSVLLSDETVFPPELEDTFYIVSLAVKQAAKEIGRVDFVSPGELVRDANGVVCGCAGFDM